MANKNIRKIVSEFIRGLVSNREGDECPQHLESFAIKPDATNPYAFVVEADGKRFRVLVKEID